VAVSVVVRAAATPVCVLPDRVWRRHLFVTRDEASGCTHRAAQRRTEGCFCNATFITIGSQVLT
jgi:hypothetical protein